MYLDCFHCEERSRGKLSSDRRHFGSTLPTRGRPATKSPDFSLLPSKGVAFFRHFAGPSDNLFLNSAFPRLSWLPPFAVGLERRRGFNGASVIFFTNFTWSAGTSERSGESSRRSSHFGHLSFLDKIPRLRLLATGALRRPR